MGKVSKILIVLIFLISVGFLVFSINTTRRVEDQKAVIRSLKENIASLKETITSLTETIYASREKITSLRGKIVALETELTATKRKLTETKAAKKRVERELTEVKRENSRLNITLSREREKVKTLTAEKKNLEREVASLTSKKRDLETVLTGRIKIAEEKLAKLEAQGILVERKVVLPDEEKFPKIVAGVEGKIVDARDARKAGIVAINFKGGIRPQEGATFYVIRADEVKARLVLKEIYNTIMVAQMEKVFKDIRPDDLVKLVLWVEEEVGKNDR